MPAKYTRLCTAASGMLRFEGIDVQVHPRFTPPPFAGLQGADAVHRHGVHRRRNIRR